ncbi:MAG: DUF1800 domain-containing protein [Pseudomonadota bacterium]|uniref:DUF1800 domain-containing protein n=1 Tax=Aquabacterium sp. TaxID=1872578 RepID=UPI003BB0B18D
MKWMGWSAGRMTVIAAMAAAMLSACGGGGGGGSAGTGNATGSNGSGTSSGQAAAETGNASQAAAITERDAHRFLGQASFGATPSTVASVRSLGYAGWLDNQFDTGLSVSHLSTADASVARLNADKVRASDIPYTWWTHAVQDPAQLRQRVAYALSQIFVVSTMDSVLADNSRLVASYMDMLTQNSSSTYRELLEAVALHPAMGIYLSTLQNRKEDPVSGRIPDENFAREVMQLFSIGLYELNDDGSLKLRNGQPIETYTSDDVRGLAKVFTGWSWHRPAGSTVEWWRCFWPSTGCNDYALQSRMPMSGYAEAHSTSEKRFLGITIPAQTTANPALSLRLALDRLATHPNTAPFISKQLIQRLVTSNPSPAYVARVTNVFRSSNGSLRAVVKAILLDAEARTPATSGVSMPSHGKLREPVLRLSQLLRAIPHSSTMYTTLQSAQSPAPFYYASTTDDPAFALGQTPMRSPSVFNFYRPGYKPPRSQLGTLGLVAPEMQTTSETSVLGYANFITTILDQGWGETHPQTGKPDIQFNLSSLQALDDGSSSARPQRMVDEAARLLLGGPLSSTLNERVVTAVGAMPRTNDQQKRRRAAAAVALIAVSPTYIVQQ